MWLRGAGERRWVPSVEIHQLQCFIAVLEENGFKRAAERLGITQPALSYQIKRLEKELGVQLFHRRPGGIAPTEAGSALLDRAHQVIGAVREAHQAVRELSEGVSGELRIGTLACLGTYFLPKVLWQIRARYPTVRPRLLYRQPDELVQWLLASKLDVAMIPDPPPDPRLHQEFSFDDPISLVCSRGHPLYGRGRIHVAELRHLQLVSLSPQTSTGALIRGHLERLGLSLAPAFSSEDDETVKVMVEEGMGVALLPDIVTGKDVGDGARPGALARCAVDPPLVLHFVIVTSRAAHRSRALDVFVDEVRRARLVPAPARMGSPHI
jgi:LysR family hydrogen peroxide-inducible transcriptional activator